MIKDRNTNFEEHSIFLAEIAKNILDGNDSFLAIPGVREIIAMYLLIPYTTNDQLDAGMTSKTPQLDLSEEFMSGVNLRNLRDTICHSFVSVEESSPARLGRIIIDDRAQMDRKTHNQQVIKSKTATVTIAHAHQKLSELHTKVINSI
ncbi:hypothetical protein [Flavobacterium wongokense]|uniref:hypothetical protein n=1 Tax=Flavobacterium wongokense TaxID=2910674 RepID=UPI001F3B9CC7|nr:hypothetical protein [Flavobacterium sp. WG47]MCF6132749.1 hypothetical protein [Flavobacterium sp. WG47]